MIGTTDEQRGRELKERGAALLARGKVEAALAEYQRAVEALPRDKVARRKVGDLLARLGRISDAMATYQLLVGRLAAEGRALEAISISKVILQLDPTHLETQETLARLYAQRSAERPRVRLPDSMTGAIDFSRTPAARLLPKPLSALPPPASPGPGSVDLVLSELPEAPLFSELPRPVMQALLERLEMTSFSKGESIIVEGELGHSLFVLASGSVEVVRKTPPIAGNPGGDASSGQRTVDRMEEGAFFGEIGLVADVPRLASVVAAEECVVLEVTRELVAQLTLTFPFFDELVRGYYKARLLANLLRSSPLFQRLSDEERRAVVSRFELRTAHPGELLLTQGEAGRGLFLILRGRCSVSFRDVSGKDHALPGLGEGAVMGEISLLSGGAVTATVAAETACVLLFLDPATFVEHLLSNPAARALITRLGAERQGRTEAIDQQLVEPAFL